MIAGEKTRTYFDPINSNEIRKQEAILILYA